MNNNNAIARRLLAKLGGMSTQELRRIEIDYDLPLEVRLRAGEIIQNRKMSEIINRAEPPQ